MEMPVQSPFANFDPQEAMEHEAKEPGGRGQRVMENISPLFERLILEAGGNIQADAEPVKRRLDLDEPNDGRLPLFHRKCSLPYCTLSCKFSLTSRITRVSTSASQTGICRGGF